MSRRGSRAGNGSLRKTGNNDRRLTVYVDIAKDGLYESEDL